MQDAFLIPAVFCDRGFSARAAISSVWPDSAEEFDDRPAQALYWEKIVLPECACAVRSLFKTQDYFEDDFICP